MPNKKIPLILLSLCLTLNCAFAETQTQGDLQAFSNFAVKTADFSKDDFLLQVADAQERFEQCNVKAAYSDFEQIIKNIPQNDFLYIKAGLKMADLGLFNLSRLALSKVTDNEIGRNHIDDITRFYYPRKKLAVADEIFLGEVYSNIIYNDRVRDALSDLRENKRLLNDSDYANYLASLGYLKTNDVKSARRHIELALLQNPSNLNYQRLKAEILAEDKAPAEALKAVDELKKQNFFTTEFIRKINSLEQYVNYKVAKQSWDKSFHLGYYYYYEEDYAKSLRALQSAVSKKKKNNARVYALTSNVYVALGEWENALANAKKAKKIKDSSLTELAFGDIKYQNEEYRQALKHYKSATKLDKASHIPLMREADTYGKLKKDKSAQKIYAKSLKTCPYCYEAYYNIALKDTSKELTYLKKSVGINLDFKDGWIDLARVESANQNFQCAKKYLTNAYYIDQNDYRYYYYKGTVEKAVGKFSDAEYDFQKCLKLNPQYAPAKEELNL